jgi:hypothetical protein
MANHSLREFAGIGIGRISLGSTLSRAMYGSLIEKTQSILLDGDFTGLADAPNATAIVKLLEKGSAKS